MMNNIEPVHGTIAQPNPILQTDQEPAKGANKAKVIILAVAISTAVIGIAVMAVFLFMNLLKFTPGGREDIFEHNAYFVPESSKSNTKYALVDKDGKELTEYNIEKFDRFIDGYTIVKTTEGWGIINDSGKMTVKPDEYDALSRVGGLYTALKPGSSERKLLHGSGRVVTTYASSLNTDLGTDNYMGNKNAVVAVIRREGDSYDIYDAHGKKIKMTVSKKEPVVSAPYAANEVGNSVTLVSYDGGLILISNKDLKEIFRTDKVSRIYHLSDISHDNTQMVFEEVNEDENTATRHNYAIYTGGHLKEIGNECNYASVVSSESLPTGYISCSLAGGSGFYDSKGTLRRFSYTSSSNTYAIIDSSHYATYSRGGTARIGTHSISSVHDVLVKRRGYLVRSAGQYAVYDEYGVKTCSLPSNYSSFSGFDNDGIATLGVRDYQNTSANYSSSIKQYLIDKSCKKVSSEYYMLSAVGDYFAATTYTKGTSTNPTPTYDVSLIDKAGKEKIKAGEYKSFARVGYNNKAANFIIATKADNSKTLLDSKLNTIADFEGSVLYDSKQEILKVYGEKFISYYSLDGVELCSIQIGEGARTRT
ncbi:MAG: WG repeat-containing protein [Candidatus Saccharibacteria bacterium]|nr:WG repeat-containing protein [Candidatus Saccharibacteria bacterium]